MHRSKRKVLDDRNTKFSHPKSTFSPSTKWYWQNQKFCPTSSASTPQCIRLSERAKFKVPQTQRFGLPAALGSLPTLCSPVAITQTAPVTRKSHKQPTTRLRQYYCSRPILDRPRSQTHRTTREVFDNRNATLSHLKSIFPASEKWCWQIRKFSPTYFTPTPQCIRLRATAIFKLPQTQRVALPVPSASLAVLFSQVAITQTAPLTHKSHKQAPTSTGQYYFWRPILDLPRSHTPQIRRKTLGGRNTKVYHLKNHLMAS